MFRSQAPIHQPGEFHGEKGKAGMATEGTGKTARASWGAAGKSRRRCASRPKTTFTLVTSKAGLYSANLDDADGNWKRSILRFYWMRGRTLVECPVGDFFACGLGKYCQINSLAVTSTPERVQLLLAMPFASPPGHAGEYGREDMVLYYQINYALAPVPRTAAYLHAQFGGSSLREKGLYTIVDGIAGEGQYVGTYLAWEVHSPVGG